MTRFTQLYKSMNKDDRGRSKEIAENPIMAYIKGVSESDIRKALSEEDWTEKEIVEMMILAERAKSRIS
jgi:hypothetical protein